MTGRCSKCKEMCEAEEYSLLSQVSLARYHNKTIWLSNCCGAPLLEDGERSHTD